MASDKYNGLKEFITVLSMRKLEVIDFLRGFAIFTIVLMHCVQGYLDGVLHKAASLGGAGGTCVYSLQWLRPVSVLSQQDRLHID